MLGAYFKFGFLNYLTCCRIGLENNRITYTSPCKFNIYLDILGKLPGGYHEVITIMEPLYLKDHLILQEIKRGTRVRADHPGVPSGKKNIVYQAVELIREETGIKRGVSIRIEKHIPVAAGLGGGSGNAAATLVHLNRFWKASLPFSTLKRLAARLGSDVPFFLRPRTSLCRGRGEKISPLPSLPPLGAVLINPGLPLSTRWAYEQVDLVPISSHPRLKQLLSAIKSGDLIKISDQAYNIFQEVLEDKVPPIKRILNFLRRRNVLAALLSGSGATVVGVVETESKARDLAERARRFFPADWPIFSTGNRPTRQ